MTRTVPVQVTYLEMRAAPPGPPPSDPPGVTLELVAPPAAAATAARLYREVGAAWHWRDRLPWSAEQWEAALLAEGVALWVAREAGREIGYVELARSGDEVEIRYFGLVPTAMGRGLGRWLLERAITLAWTDGAARVVLNTCSLDGPAALPNYLARGFTVVREEHQLRELPS